MNDEIQKIINESSELIKRSSNLSEKIIETISAIVNCFEQGNKIMSERPVSTDALETLGKIHRKKEKRDAIHLAVLPVRAGMQLFPGQIIRIDDGEAYLDSAGLGIVDPFLTKEIDEGEKFWMVLKPRLISSLRHVWSHPAFDDEPENGDHFTLKAEEPEIEDDDEEEYDECSGC